MVSKASHFHFENCEEGRLAYWCNQVKAVAQRAHSWKLSDQGQVDALIVIPERLTTHGIDRESGL